MNTYRLLNWLESLLGVLHSDNYLLGLLQPDHGVLDVYGAMADRFRTALVQGSTDQMGAHVLEARKRLQTFIRSVREWGSGRVHRAVDELRRSLEELGTPAQPSLAEAIVDLEAALEEVDQCYEHLVSRYGATEETPRAYSLLIALDRFHSAYTTTLALAEAIAGALRPGLEDMPEGHARLDLYFEEVSTLREAEAKVVAVQMLYGEICQLLDVSESEYPLVPAKLEIGTFWAAFFGHPLVITVVSSLLIAGLQHLMETRTQAGRLKEFPRKLDALNGMLELIAHMEEAGMDASLPRERLEKAAAVIAASLTTILGDGALDEVNGQPAPSPAKFDVMRRIKAPPRLLRGAIELQSDQ
jgi:hypothetical protein